MAITTAPLPTATTTGEAVASVGQQYHDHQTIVSTLPAAAEEAEEAEAADVAAPQPRAVHEPHLHSLTSSIIH